ncbi:MAG: 23S rRNA (guanosine(2251)-2'-O)-methyltransferase RlmB [Desulfobacterales bacterium]|nr:23S rRNA (guanosine(2251)-2'-O)-methyltransferase RlmB [Desulfobacterales bacterium]
MKPEILSGIHSVHEAVRAARREILEVFFESGKKGGRLARIEQRARDAGIPVKRLNAENITALAGSRRHQGVAARVGPLPLYELQDVFTAGDKGRAPFLLLLDQVLDSHNLGAIIRTALCAGVDAIICPRDRAAGPSPTVSRISAGAMEHVRITVVTNLSAVIKTLKAEHFWVAGMDVSGDQSLFAADLSGPLAIVIGGEEKGLRPLVKKQCDYLVSIPQASSLNSLNASVAGAVVMYEVYRQRAAK